MKNLCHQYGVPFIVNDNVEIAIKCGADGVHVGQSDMEAGAVRKNRTRIGHDHRSVSTDGRSTLAAQAAGADYLGVGAVFPTSTKLDAAEVPHDRLERNLRGGRYSGHSHWRYFGENIMELAESGVVTGWHWYLPSFRQKILKRNV